MECFSVLKPQRILTPATTRMKLEHIRVEEQASHKRTDAVTLSTCLSGADRKPMVVPGLEEGMVSKYLLDTELHFARWEEFWWWVGVMVLQR